MEIASVLTIPIVASLFKKSEIVPQILTPDIKYMSNEYVTLSLYIHNIFSIFLIQFVS